MIFKSSLFKDIPYFIICCTIVRIYILSNCSLEDKWNLRYNRYVPSQRMNSHFQCIIASYLIYRSYFWLKNSKKCLNNWTFSSSSPSNNTYFLTFSRIKWYFLEDQGKLLPISSWIILQNNCWHKWPFLMHINIIFRRLNLLFKSNLNIVSSSKFFILLNHL